MNIVQGPSSQSLKERWEVVSGTQGGVDRSRKDYLILMMASWICAALIIGSIAYLAVNHHLDRFFSMATGVRLALAVLVASPVLALNIAANKHVKLYRQFQEDASRLAYALYIGTHVAERHYPDVPIEPTRGQAYRWASKTVVTVLMEWIHEDMVAWACNVIACEAGPHSEKVRAYFREGVTITHGALKPFGEQEKPWEEYFDTAKIMISERLRKN